MFKEGEDINSPLQIGDILEVEPGLFVRIKEIIKETEEDFADIKKWNIRIKTEVIANDKDSTTRKPRRRQRSGKD